MPLELLFLGTGTSAGIPMIGCDCRVCRSDDPRDQRCRSSVMVRYCSASETVATSGDTAMSADAPRTPCLCDTPEHALSPKDLAHRLPDDPRMRRYVIDTSPEFRLQMVRHRVSRIDAILFTHAHADHIFGLDDVRRFNAVMDRPIDIFADAHAMEIIQRTFRYIFEPHRNVNKSFIPALIPRVLTAGERLMLGGATWTPLTLKHGRLSILGFRVDFEGASLAYCTDVSEFPPETLAQLADLDVLVIDALRYRPHPTHLTVDEALEIIARLRPRRAWLTHLAHDVHHAELASRLPAHVQPAYDGLCVNAGGAATT